jgi:hypothetical protein
MAIVHISRGGGMTRESYEKISAKMGTDENPPGGLIVHTAGDVGGAWQIVDVWESVDAKERFERDRLMPAITSIVGAANMEQGQPDVVEYEATHVLNP